MSPFGWRKSTYSDGMKDCVEVADNIPGCVPIRDSKRRPHVITAQPGSWAAFVAALRTGAL
ncbi:DUF397 domain-containing protein [Streptomyces luteireticuli]|uniref:DUF397 domain-containing protein n=1 Tax=Streptomyces luteireticuli TaxID=173858 RepID=A0ABN0YUJ7_9ACTN